MSKNKLGGLLKAYMTFMVLMIFFSLSSWSMEIESTFSSEKKKVRILTIDGGNIQGIIPITILEKMEEILQSCYGKEARLTYCFDLIAGTSTGAIITLGLNAGKSAEELAKLYLNQGEKLFSLLDNPSEKAFEECFGDIWLSESFSHVLIPGYNMGQQCAYLFDSYRAKELKSEDFKMRDIARASITASTNPVSIENKKEEKFTFIRGEGYAFDPTFEAIKKADEMFPGCDCFIASLGTGEAPRQFGKSTLNNEEIPYHLNSSAKDRHLNYLGYLEETINRESQKVDYRRIQLTLDPSVIGKGALRQAGLYVANPMNGKTYTIFEKIIAEMKEAYKNYTSHDKLQHNTSLKEPSPRPWKSITKDIPLHYLLDRPDFKTFTESFPEGSDESYLSSIWNKFYLPPSLPISQVAIVGMGGLGKSYTALAYAYEALDSKAYNLIYWLSSETEDSLFEGYKNLLRKIEAPVKGDEDPNGNITLVKEYVPRKGKWLLIYDNVPHPTFLYNKIPQEGGHVLITSQYTQDWKGSTIKLGLFQPEEAADYLLKVTSSADREVALELALELGYLPLALSYVRGYIICVREIEENYGLKAYLVEFRKEPETHYKSHSTPSVIEEQQISYERLIAKTWGIAGNKIGSFAKDLMVYFSYLAPDFIIANLFQFLPESSQELRNALLQLNAFSLVKKNIQNQNCFSVHRLLQLVIRQKEEATHLESLPISFSRILSNFWGYSNSIKSNLAQIKNLGLSELEKWYITNFTLNANLEMFNTHLLRLSNNTNNSPEEEWGFKLKFGTKALQRLFDIFMISLRKEIRTKLEQAKSEQDRKKLEATILKDELQAKRIALNPELSKEIAEALPTILSLELSNEDTIYMAEIVASIAVQERPGFVNAIQALLTPGMGSNELSAVVEVFHRLPSMQHNIFVERMAKYDQAKVIKTYGEINPTERQEFIPIAQSLLKHNMTGSEQAGVIRALYTIDLAQRFKFSNTLQPLLIEDLGNDTWVHILSHLASVASEKRIDMCKKFVFFWTLLQREENSQNQDRWIKKILEAAMKKEGFIGIINICSRINFILHEDVQLDNIAPVIMRSNPTQASNDGCSS